MQMINQCDWCMRWLPVNNWIHYEEHPWWPFVCTAHLYKKKYSKKEKYLHSLWITEAWMYNLAIIAYEGYDLEKPPLTFVEWCTHKFDSMEDEFLS